MIGNTHFLYLNSDTYDKLEEAIEILYKNEDFSVKSGMYTIIDTYVLS